MHIKINFLNHGQPSQLLKLLNMHHFPSPPSKAIATLIDQTSAQPKQKQALSLSPTLPAQTILKKSFAPTTYSPTTSKSQDVPFPTRQDASFALQLVVTTTYLYYMTSTVTPSMHFEYPHAKKNTLFQPSKKS